MSNAEGKRKTRSQADTAHAGANTEESQEWLKKLGAVAADQCYEDPPDMARIEETLSASEEAATRPAKTESLENHFNRRCCHHLTREMHLESIKSNKDTMCPVKVTLEQGKIAFASTLTEKEKKMEVWTDYLPCHLCPKHYQRGQELLKDYRLFKDQIEFLQEFDSWQERPVSNPDCSHRINHDRKRSAKRLEKQKLMCTRLRFWENPAKPGKPELTLMAKLSISSHLATDNNREFVEKNLPRILLKKPLDVLGEYVSNLKREIEHLSEFIKTRKQQRTPTGQDITVYRAELTHQLDFVMKSVNALPSAWLPDTFKDEAQISAETRKT